MFFLRNLLFFIALIFSSVALLAGDAQKIFKKVSPSVVIIYTTDQYDHPMGQGSGVILTEDGKIITNFHVIAEGEKIQVHLNKKLMQAKIIGIDPSHDLAIIKLDAMGLSPVKRSSREAEIGEKVFAIGSPLGYENTISEGIISGRRRSGDTTMQLLQITAPFSAGSSGGAVVDSRGALIGISTMNVRGGAQNINFAVPAEFIDSVQLKDHISRGELMAIAKLREALSIDLRSGDVREAIRLFNEVLRYDLLNETALQQLCYAYLYAGDDSHALEYCNRLAALNAENPAAHYVAASIHFRNGNYENVKKSARRMLAIKTNWATAHCFYGRSCYLLGQLDTAEMQLRTATSLDSADSDAHYFLACLYTDQKKINYAFAEAHKSIERNYDCYECNVLLGALYREKGNPDEAIAYYKDAIQIKRSNPVAYMKLAEVYFQLNLYTMAVQQATLALKNDPDYCDAYELLLDAVALQPNVRSEILVGHFRNLRNCDPVKAFAYAAYFDSSGVKEGTSLGADMLRGNKWKSTLSSLTGLLNPKPVATKKSGSLKANENNKYGNYSPARSGNDSGRDSRDYNDSASDTIMLGGDYYINCNPLIRYGTINILTVRNWKEGQVPDLDAELFDGNGDRMAIVKHGIVQPGSQNNIKTKLDQNEFTVFVAGQKAGTLINLKKEKYTSPGLILLTFSLSLPDGYVLRCTPYKADKRMGVFSGRNTFRNSGGFNLK